LGLVANLARPGGNATGYNMSVAEIPTKRLELLHAMVPKAVRIAMLVNPENVPVAERMLHDVPQAARAIGLQIQIVNASTKDEIEAAFVTFAHDQIDALFVGPDTLFISQREQFATLTARYRIPATFSTREEAEAGGLMSYGTDIQAMWHQVGTYTGQILKGAKPADLPVMQSTKFELVINLKTAKALGLTIPAGVLSIADEVIE
jgi:putative ABC transport system substrate-binding protein